MKKIILAGLAVIVASQSSFEQIDSDHSGALDETQARVFANFLDDRMTDDRFKEGFKFLDLNKNGLIQREQFDKVYNPNNSPNQDQIQTKMFYETDTNGDGKIDRKQGTAYAKANIPTLSDTQIQVTFQMMDLNHDGFIDIDQFKTMGKSAKQDDQSVMLRAFDLDGNGGLDLQQAKKFALTINPNFTDEQISRTFLVIDSDKDGLVTFEQFQQFNSLSQQQKKQRSSQIALNEIFGKMDSNKDGVVDKKQGFEFANSMSPGLSQTMFEIGFSMLDLNKDQSVDIQELKESYKKSANFRRKRHHRHH